ncbi:MAG: CAP domain-containing protein [Bacteroidetes bacterium]|nr:CAP domain-containing protein [Bacteroidota bacterium]MBU1720513.1 CAP domain-containing protein [Bacteroidota bacterium]
MKRFILILAALLSVLFTFAQDNSEVTYSVLSAENDTICLSADEYKLWQMINEYRKQKRLPAIPLSRSLTYVAQKHAEDLSLYFKFSSRCNMHTWSDKGNWTSCCYSADHKKASCMWDKPREMTSYPGNGYEISHGGDEYYVVTPDFALTGWKGSTSHNEVILNKGIWKDVKWKAIGIGMYKNFAVVWFGEEEDTEAEVTKCK